MSVRPLSLMRPRHLFPAALAALTMAAAAAAPPSVRFVTCDEARAVLLTTAALAPPALGEDGLVECATVDAWVRQRDAEVRARVQRGEDDSLVPLLLFGTSFTGAPRLTRAFFDEAARAAARDGSGQAGVERAFTRAFERRLDDLLNALAAPGENLRLAWARDTLTRHGHRLDSEAARAAAGRFLVETFARVTQESRDLAGELSTEPADGAASSRRARIFAARGLAPDTSWSIGYAIHRTLAALKNRAVLAPGSMREVAIVGPGLDVLDKDEGTDRFPPQSLQPFALADSLLAHGLADAASLRLTTLDVNPRVNAHLQALATRPRRVTLHLTRDDGRAWTADARGYWGTAGGHLTPAGRRGTPGSPPAPERDIVVDARWPARLTVLDANVVYQRLDVPADRRADLVVATNVLLYYDTAEQALAAANVAHLLRPRGMLITNTRLHREDPAVGTTGRQGASSAPAVAGLELIFEELVVFSDRAGDGERMYVYRKP